MLSILRDMFSLGMAPAASMAAMQFVQFGNPSLIPTFHRLVWLSKPFWCSWVHFLLENSELGPGLWVCTRCPPALNGDLSPWQWFLSGSLKPPAYVLRMSGASDKTGPSHFQTVNTVGIEVSSTVPILWIHSYRIELLADTDIASAAFVDWKDWNCSSSDAIVN